MKSQNTLLMSTRSRWSTFSLLVLSILTYLHLAEYIIPNLKEIWDLKPETTTISDIHLIWVPIIGYFLIAGIFCLVVNIFKPLKAWDERGLIEGLIWGIIVGLTLGLMIIPIDNPIVGLIICLSMGLTLGLVLGLTGGLVGEFN